MKRALHIVETPPEQPKDIQALNMRDILKRDWSAVHTSADRRGPVAVGEPRKRIWRG